MFDRNAALETIFSEAADQVRAGRSIPAVLAQYPAHAAALEPLLRAIVALRTAMPPPTLSADALDRIRARAVAVAQQQRHSAVAVAPLGAREPGAAPRTRRAPWAAGLAPLLRGGMAVIALALAVGLLLSLARQGDPGPTPPANYATFSGVITAIGPASWQVDNTTLLVDPGTRVEGRPEIGASPTAWPSRPGPGRPCAPSASASPPARRRRPRSRPACRPARPPRRPRLPSRLTPP